MVLCDFLNGGEIGGLAEYIDWQKGFQFARGIRQASGQPASGLLPG